LCEEILGKKSENFWRKNFGKIWKKNLGIFGGIFCPGFAEKIITKIEGKFGEKNQEKFLLGEFFARDLQKKLLQNLEEDFEADAKRVRAEGGILMKGSRRESRSANPIGWNSRKIWWKI
jgi:hypothetical protein